MLIRKAIDKDAREIVFLLKEVLEIYASIRQIFLSLELANIKKKPNELVVMKLH